MDYDFKVGDEVEAEFYIDRPRWSWDNDSRPMVFAMKDSYWLKGKVTIVDDPTSPIKPAMLVHFNGVSMYAANWWFPIPGSTKWASGRSGWPRKINQATQTVAAATQNLTKVQQLQKRFIGKLNTIGCECGAWIDGGPHSSWCACAKKEIKPIINSLTWY